MHPSEVVYLEHDGKVLLVNDEGQGPKRPVQGRLEGDESIRFPTKQEIESMGIDFIEKENLVLRYGQETYVVVKAYPKLDWPVHCAWKDKCA